MERYSFCIVSGDSGDFKTRKLDEIMVFYVVLA